MTATDIFWDYFQPIARDIADVRHVSLSDGDRMERLIANSVSENIYPAVFVLRPKYRPFDTGAGHFYAIFDVTFFVFCQSNVGETDSQDIAFDQAETIALAVLHQLRQDHLATEKVDFEYGSAHMEPVTMMTLDSTQGYEVKLKLGLEAYQIFS